MTTTNATHDAQRVALEAQKACPCRFDRICECMTSIAFDVSISCPAQCVCNGVGRVPILDGDNEFGLRVKCRCSCHRTHTKDINSCVCQGLDYIPSDDFWAWNNAAKKSLRPKEWIALAKAAQQGKVAFYTAIADAVEARAGKAP